MSRTRQRVEWAESARPTAFVRRLKNCHHEVTGWRASKIDPPHSMLALLTDKYNVFIMTLAIRTARAAILVCTGLLIACHGAGNASDEEYTHFLKVFQQRLNDAYQEPFVGAVDWRGSPVAWYSIAFVGDFQAARDPLGTNGSDTFSVQRRYTSTAGYQRNEVFWIHLTKQNAMISLESASMQIVSERKSAHKQKSYCVSPAAPRCSMSLI